MVRAVAYDRQTLDNPNPLARYAHRTRLASALRLVERQMHEGERILDLGAGTGAFLQHLGQRRPDLRLVAFEPIMVLHDRDIPQVHSLTEIATASVDVVSAFEVFEHLDTITLCSIVTEIKRVLNRAGRLIVSVPIMQGLALPIKEASRALLFRRPTDYTVRDLRRGLVGRSVERSTNLLTSHKGFSHRDLEAALRRDFSLTEAFCSPFPVLPWWVNSQRFMVFVAA